jgi:hypothetical protein
MRPVEKILEWGEGTKENDEGMNPTRLYYKNFVNVTMHP